MRVTNNLRPNAICFNLTCGGSGQILKTFCEADSQGMILEDETVSIKIPAGVDGTRNTK
jgi:molecular chaperone DnaJ